MLVISYLLFGINFILLLKEYYSICEATTCSNCIGNANAYLRNSNDNLECYWCSDTNTCSNNNSSTSCLHICNNDDDNNGGSNSSTSLYTLMFIIGIVVFSCGGCAICYMTRKSNSVSRMRELISPLLRNKAKNEIFRDDESEWMCAICGFDNKIRNIYCIMCGTDQKFTDEYRSIKKKKSNFDWHKSNNTKQLIDDNKLDITIPDEAQMSSSSVSMSLKYFCVAADVDSTLSTTKRKEAINYRRLNQLNLRQKSARRRKMWQRRVDITTGQLVWVRVPIFENHNLVSDNESYFSAQGSYEEEQQEGRQSLLKDRKISGSDSVNSLQSANSYVPSMYNPIADLMLAASNQAIISPKRKGRNHDSRSPMSKKSFDSFNDSVYRSHSPGFTSVFDKEGELVWEKIDCQSMKSSKVHQDHTKNPPGPIITKYTSPIKKPLPLIRQQRLYQAPTQQTHPQDNSIRNLRASSSTSSNTENIAKNLFPVNNPNQTLDAIDVIAPLISQIDVINTQQQVGHIHMNNNLQPLSVPPPPQEEDVTPMDSLLYIPEPEEVDLAGIAALSFRSKYSWFLDRLSEFQIPPNQGYIKIEVRRNKLLEDSHSVLTQFQLQDLHKYIRIEFYKESGVDAGGLEREWFEEVTSLIFAPESGLFTCGGNTSTLSAYHINPTSSIYNSKHLSYFKFIGRFIGIIS